MTTVDPLTAAGVLVATAATDAVYVMFTSAVIARKRVPAESAKACPQGSPTTPTPRAPGPAA